MNAFLIGLLAVAVGQTQPVSFVEAKDTGIPAALAAWNPAWPWGVQAIDYDRDGKMDLCVTDHYGGARILRQHAPLKFTAVDVGLTTGTFRPHAWDFNGDGWTDLMFRSDASRTAFLNQGGKFVALNFQYPTGEPIIQTIADFDGDGDKDFGHAYARWHWTGSNFTKVPYSHPVPASIKPFLDAQWAASKPNIPLRVWFYDLREMTVCAGFTAYGGSSFGRYVVNGIDKTESLGLPLTGTPVHAEDFNRDRKPDFIIVGKGLYLSQPDGKYALKPGPLTDFVKTPGVYYHQVTPAQFNGDRLTDLVVLNPRGRDTRIFQQTAPGEFKLIRQIGSWDGEPTTVADFNGDGRRDVAVGAGGNVVILLTQ